MMSDRPKWLEGLLRRNSNEVLAAVFRLAAEIDRKGWTSANDIDSTAFHQKNAVGGAFKVLRSLGCVPVGWTTAEAQRKHGRAIRKWGASLERGGSVKLRQFREASRGLLVDVDEQGQELMAL